MDEAFLGHGWLEIDLGDRAGGQVVAVVGLLDDGNPPKLVQGAKLAILEEVERNGIAQTSRKHSSPTKKGW